VRAADVVSASVTVGRAVVSQLDCMAVSVCGSIAGSRQEADLLLQWVYVQPGAADEYGKVEVTHCGGSGRPLGGGRLAEGGRTALCKFSIAFFYLPTLGSDGEQAMRRRPTAAALQVLGEQLMMELRRLVPLEGSWERPAVHILLELLYRTLLFVQLGTAV